MYLHLQSWYIDEAKQATLLIRALNFNVGLQKYIILFITSLEGIASLSAGLRNECENIFTGVCVLEGESDTRGPGIKYSYSL